MPIYWYSFRINQLSPKCKPSSHTDANTHTLWAGCVFAHAALWEEKENSEKKEITCGETEKWQWWFNDDGGGQYQTYQKRYSSLVSDSDSVGGTIVMCGTEVMWGREGWRRKEKRSANSYSEGKDRRHMCLALTQIRQEYKKMTWSEKNYWGI